MWSVWKSEYVSKIEKIGSYAKIDMNSLHELCILVLYSFFVFLKDEERKWTVVVMCEEREN